MQNRLQSILVFVLICMLLTPSVSLAQQNTSRLTVYYTFSAPTEFYLVPVDVLTPAAEDLPFLSLVMLIQGPPSGSFLHRTIPADTRILDLSIQDGLATVSFSREITQGAGGSASEALLIASIANTLCRFGEIERVDILVEGERTSLGGHIELEGPISYNPDVVIPQPFSDVSGHWAEGNINAFFLTGMVEGYGDGSFRPQREVSRAEFIKLLVLASGHEPYFADQPTFADVTTEHWAYGFVEAAVAHGILLDEDYPGGLRPDLTLPRLEMAIMLTRARNAEQKAIELRDADLPFTDIAHLAPWARGFIAAVGYLDLMHGDAEGTFRPSSTSTRAEVTAVLTRLMGMGEKNVRMAFPKPDAVPGDWVLLGGVARAFEATVEARVLDDSGNEYVRSFTTATDAGPNWGFWAMMLPAPDGSHITLEAFTTSAKDGSVQDLISRQLFR